jgi:hypothetical protein
MLCHLTDAVFALTLALEADHPRHIGAGIMMRNLCNPLSVGLLDKEAAVHVCLRGCGGRFWWAAHAGALGRRLQGLRRGLALGPGSQGRAREGRHGVVWWVEPTWLGEGPT